MELPLLIFLLLLQRKQQQQRPLIFIVSRVVLSSLVGLFYGFLAGLVGSQCILELKEIGTCVRVRLLPMFSLL